MKIPAFTFGVAFASAAACAAEAPALAFPEPKIEAPAFSLLEAAKQRLPLGTHESVFASFRKPLPRREEPAKLISKMPILVPGPSQAKMLIKPPEDGIDYKLLIKKPDVESVK